MALPEDGEGTGDMSASSPAQPSTSRELGWWSYSHRLQRRRTIFQVCPAEHVEAAQVMVVIRIDRRIERTRVDDRDQSPHSFSRVSSNVRAVSR